MKMNNRFVIIIPAYNPDQKMVTFVSELYQKGFDKIIVVDDGSDIASKKYFDIIKNDYHCLIVNHKQNKGYGKALITGGLKFIEEYQDDKAILGAIHCDADGQHHVEDIIRCAKLIETNPDKIIVGVREFDNEVPFKSRFGNIITRKVFDWLFNIKIGDTQCGLRGFPKKYLKLSTEIIGNGYEYTTELLLKANDHKITLLTYPIKTIYINNNESTHFNTFKDSIKIYRTILRYKFNKNRG